MRPRLEKGLVQVYTGPAKGKSTAAFGLTVRAVGHGFRVFIIQFMKGMANYGELAAFKRLAPECIVENFGGKGWVVKGQAKPEDISEAQKAMARAEEVILSDDWDIVIMDEINNAIWFDLIDVAAVLRLIDKKPERVELVLTGRNAPPEIVTAADLVTEMENIKHPCDHGIGARKGIEY